MTTQNQFRERITWLLSYKQLTQRRLGELAGVATGTVNQWVSGGSASMTAQAALNLSLALRLSIRWLVTGEGDPFDFNLTECASAELNERVPCMVRAVTAVFAQSAEPELMTEEKAERIFFEPEWFASRQTSSENCVCMRMPDSAMETSVAVGDRLIVDLGSRAIQNGRLYALTFKGQYLVRRVLKRQNSCLLVGDNPECEMLESSAEWPVAVLGKVIWHGGDIL